MRIRDPHDQGLDAERRDREGDASGKSTDKLAVVVGPQKIQYMINGKRCSARSARVVARGRC
jgi:hypothetical protein